MGRSCSKQGRSCRVAMEKDDDTHLSGAYIRSLVQHLTSTKTKEPFNGDQKLTNKNEDSTSDHNDNTQKKPPPQHKKQVRRRLHTTKPYQERLLNMAEARREIVTALKFHRASMKQQEAAIKTPQPSSNSNTNPTDFSNFLGPHSPLSSPPSAPYYWPISTIAPPPLPPFFQENMNFTLPNQTLGLNLNFQDFDNLDTNLYHKPTSIYSSSSPSSSSSAVISVAGEEVGVANSSGGVTINGGLHQAMDDHGMEEIRSVGEHHQIEWNDTINLVTSARWFKFLKTMEIEPEEEEKVVNEEDDLYEGYHPFDQVMEFPPWLINANESSCLEQHFDDHFSNDYLQDPDLPFIDIGEIEAMDEEWLS